MKAYRWLDKLTSWFRKKVELFLREVWDTIFITETYRSQERQNYLYSLWRTKPGNKVTWTLDSNHSGWTAIDIAFHWEELYPSSMYSWREVAEVAKKYWIDWWYDLWKTDKPHFQDNWQALEEVEDKIFLDDSRFGHLIEKDLNNSFKFNDYLDDRPATIADIKELITLYDQRKR